VNYLEYSYHVELKVSFTARRLTPWWSWRSCTTTAYVSWPGAR
jgi:hypothetical protein